MQELNTVTSEHVPGIAGLYNEGAYTCYLNSVLQLLSNIPKFRQLFISHEYQRIIIEKFIKANPDKEIDYTHMASHFIKTMAYQFNLLFVPLWVNKYDTIQVFNAVSFRRILGNNHPVFLIPQQQDADECLRKLLEFVESDIGTPAAIRLNVDDADKLIIDKLESDDGSISKSASTLLLKTKPLLLKQYTRYKYLCGKYGQNYSVLNDMFDLGILNTITCKNCGDQKFNYVDEISLWIDITSLQLNEELIAEEITLMEKEKEEQQIKRWKNMLDRCCLNKQDLNTKPDTKSDTQSSETEKPMTAPMINQEPALLGNTMQSEFMKKMIHQMQRRRATDRLYKKKSATIEDCLDSTFKEDIISGCKCDNCDNESDASKTLSIMALPKTLILSLRRYDYMQNKNSTPIKYQNFLDISKYIDKDVASNIGSTKYRLVSVINQYGSLEGGHYTCTAYNDAIGKWVLFNDQNVRIIDDSFIGKESSEAYLLAYVRVE